MFSIYGGKYCTSKGVHSWLFDCEELRMDGWSDCRHLWKEMYVTLILEDLDEKKSSSFLLCIWLFNVYLSCMQINSLAKQRLGFHTWASDQFAAGFTGRVDQR